MPLVDWTGNAALVTGGASGLGAATAMRLAKAGLKVTILDLNGDLGRQQAESIKGHYTQVDVTDPESVSAGIADVQAHHGPARILVNCAGIGGAAKTVSRGEAHDPDMFRRTIMVNLIGSFTCASQAAVGMAAADPVDADGSRGVIINTASVAAYDGQVGQVAYAASKGGIAAMTLPMARDLADKGIRVCTVAPGLFLTPLLDGLSKEVQASLGQQVPFPSRLGKAEEYAEMVHHIIQNPMLNGEVIRLDGAIRMAPR